MVLWARRWCAAALVAAPLAAAACGAPAPMPLTPATVADDLDALAVMPIAGDRMHALHRLAFRDLFGDVAGADAQRFVAARARRFVAAADIAATSPPLGAVVRGLESLPEPPGAPPAPSLAAPGVVNLGAQLAVMAALAGVPASIGLVDGQVLPIDSTRAGILVLPAHDLAAEVAPSARLASRLRQAALVHQARHSDCPGGLARLAAGVGDDTAARRACGQPHVACLQGELAGLWACDQAPWGGLSAELLFWLAARSDPSLAAGERDVVAAQIIAVRARLHFADTEAWAGHLGGPELADGAAAAVAAAAAAP